MRYIQRDDKGVIIGHFANPQPYAMEMVPDDHPDIISWDMARKLRPKRSIEQRLTRLEELLESLLLKQ